MAKRQILPDNYNPIGDRLKKALTNPVVVQLASESEKLVDEPEISQPIEDKLSELINTEPVKKELRQSSIRFCCTANERKQWHSLSFELTEESGKLSHIIRAALLLVENSYENLKRNKLEVQRLRHPSKEDKMGLLFYEQRLAELLYEAISVSGPPKW